MTLDGNNLLTAEEIFVWPFYIKSPTTRLLYRPNHYVYLSPCENYVLSTSINTISLGQVPPNLRHSLSTVPSQSGTPFQPASQKLRHWPALNPSWRNLRDLAPRPLPPYAQHPRQRHTLSRGSADYYSRFQKAKELEKQTRLQLDVLARFVDEMATWERFDHIAAREQEDNSARCTAVIQELPVHLCQPWMDLREPMNHWRGTVDDAGVGSMIDKSFIDSIHAITGLSEWPIDKVVWYDRCQVYQQGKLTPGSKRGNQSMW